MSARDLAALSPLLVLGGGAVAVLVAISFLKSRRIALAGTLAVLAAAAGALAAASEVGRHEVASLLVVDGSTITFWAILLGATAAVALLAHDYLEGRREEREEFHPLLLLAAFGALVLAASDHVASLFLGLETLSISLYALIAYLREEPAGLEAGLKYLVLAGAASAFLLFGAALVYAEVGSLAFAAATAVESPLGATGLALFLVGVGFKLSLVPFHQWTPDVYRGAPAPTAALIATVSKVAVVAALLRFHEGLPATRAGGPVFLALAAVSFASMVAGNLLALLSRDLKRLLAFSSIAHLGYLLVALLASGELAPEAVAFYAAAYTVTILGAFGVVGVLAGAGREASDLDDYRGLFWTRPGLAALLTADLFSLAGIPLTAGFVGKFYVLAAGVERSEWLLVATLLATSAVGLFYYLRVVFALFASPPERSPAIRPAATGACAGWALAALAALLFWMGVLPGFLGRRLEATTGSGRPEVPAATPPSSAER